MVEPPEFLGKKIESFEIKMTSLSILVMPLLVLIGTALAVTTAAGRAGVFNPGGARFQRSALCRDEPRQQQRQRIRRSEQRMMGRTMVIPVAAERKFCTVRPSICER